MEATTTTTTTTTVKAPQAGAKVGVGLFGKRVKRGWRAIDRAELPVIEGLARDYMKYLADAKMPRRAVRGLVKVFKNGARALRPKQRLEHAPGTRFWFVHPGGDAAAFIALGKRPIEEGARIVIAAVDAPRIDLKQRPVYGRAGLTMLDTRLYGRLDLKSWLSRPLALYLYASRTKRKGGDLDLAIGERATDPVLVIPDLLPHLSRKVQRKAVVDKAERMDAIAARKRTALLAFLRTHGVNETVFHAGEVSLVPAGKPTFVGVDRAMIAGYGHSGRALAYAAIRAMIDSKVAPHHTAIVIVISKSQLGYTGSTGLAFVKTALSRIIGALSTEGDKADILSVRRIYTRSAALFAANRRGTPSRGLVLNPRSDDALPTALRRVLDSFRATKAQYQLLSTSAWGSTARTLGTLDMDTVEVSLTVTGRGTPMELLSTLDLYQARRAFAGWLTRK